MLILLFCFAGSVCGTNIDECFSSPCQNNATCVDGENSYTCHCLSGYQGSHCEEEIDYCLSEVNLHCFLWIYIYICMYSYRSMDRYTSPVCCVILFHQCVDVKLINYILYVFHLFDIT